MRKLYILLFLTFGSLVAALAQPTISIGDGEGCTNEQICLPVTTENFTNINSMRFSFLYNPAVLTFTTAQNFHPDLQAPAGNLGVALFSEITLGEISFATWETGACESPMNIGVNLTDGETLFELCFTASGIYGDQTEISIGNTPTPIRVTRNATLCNNIGLITESGNVTLCVRELNITATDVTGNEGDQVCVGFNVTGFDNLSGVQYTVNYDPAFLEFVSLIPNSNLFQNTLGSYGFPPNIPDGTITVSWSFFVPGQTQPSLPDGEDMFTACFNIVGNCETNTQITFSSTPTLIEAFNEDPENPSQVKAVPFSQTPAAVSINDCNPTGLEIIIDCGAPVEINDEFCVSFSAGNNFDNVRDMSYIMQWNANILEFVSINDPNNLLQLTLGDFDDSNVGNGILGLDWDVTGASQNMNNMELIYNVCFRVIGLGGDSPIQIVTPGQATSEGEQTTINPTNCVVEVTQPASIGINFNDMEVPLGGMGCLPVTVTNFTEVTSMQFTMVWDENIWAFLNLNNINPLINGANFTPIGLSSLTFQWDDAAGVTLANDAVLFELCYETAPGASPGDCDLLFTGGFPLAERATTISSNVEDVGLIINTGDLCVLFPEGFGLTAETTTGGWRDTICMNFTVESFDNIIDADFSVHYNPLVLEFASAAPIGWTGLEFMPPSPAGTIPFQFANPTPVVLADGAVAFEVCFVLIGNPEDCYGVSIQDNPDEILLTTNGEGSIVITDGEICVEDKIVIQEIIITPESCPGACDATVTIIVYEWPDQCFIGTTWHTEPNPQFTPLFLENVCAGDLSFTLFDNCSGVTLTDTINIPISGTIPTAVIGGDNPRFLACDPPQIIINAVDQGEDVSIAWFLNSVLSAPEGTLPQLSASEAGNYILQLTDNASGCTATDTVTVFLPSLPGANAGEDAAVVCNTPCVTLNGTATAAVNPSFSWSVVGGTNPEYLDSTTINMANLTVCGPGIYRLTVRDAITGCEATDDVAVMEENIFPNACLDPETGGDMTLEQNCDGLPSEFDASCSLNAGLEVVYVWYDEEGSPTTSGPTNAFTELGSYQLIVTEITTGCTDTVYAHVIENSNAPVVTLDAVGSINCITDSITLNATTIPDDPGLDILWTGPAFAVNGFENTLTPTAISPGTYQILVTDPNNNCESIASVVIADQTAAPVAAIINEPASLVRNCNTLTVLLDATASSEGDTIAYQWYSNDLDTPISPMGNADTLEVSTAGNYIIEVMNMTTGCTSLDTVVVTDEFEMPQILLSSLTDTIDCITPEVMVTAIVNGSPNFTFQGWTVSEGGNIIAFSADSLTITADAAGVYNIVVSSNLSGCTGEADFVIAENLTLPSANVVTDTLYLTCLADFVTLNGAGSSTGTNFTYVWENLDGPQPDMPNLIQTNVTEAGTYLFTVTNGDNNCTKDTSLVVLTDTIAPTGMIAEVEDLTCQDMSREITIVVSNAEQFVVEWDPVTIPATGEVVTITEPGIYTATMINTETACSGTATITVGGDLTPPTINLGVLPEFDCSDFLLPIDASASGLNDDFDSIEWTSSTGGLITPDNGNLVVNIDNIGEYTLRIQSAANGCTADTTFTIGTVTTLSIPEVIIADPADLGCNGAAIILDGSATGDEADFSSIIWSGEGEGTGFILETTAVGEYTLTVVANGALACEASATVSVNPDENTPVADAGASFEHGCGVVSTLDGTNSTPQPGATVNYEWLINEGELQGDVTSPTPTVTGSGEFRLVVTNIENGCSDTSDVVIVTLVLPDSADAGSDFVACNDMAELDAVAVVGTEGVWTTAGAATIDMTTDPATMITNLLAGQNIFVWTLSADNCPDYSSDSVVISLATSIIAADDQLQIAAGDREGMISIIANDQLGGNAQFDITVLTPPTFGTYDTTAFKQGILDFSLNDLEFGTTAMVYQICSTDCPTLCDTATIFIEVELDGEPFVPNAFTPNDDGSNDQFIFDILLFNPADKYPDNELIVFSRWGDIIYESKPYNNDWAGLNMDGKPVPEGTYYYILRLNIGQGEIIRGDVTIIR